MNRGFQILLQRNIGLLKPMARNITTTPMKSSGQWVYRESGVRFIPKRNFIGAEIIGAVMWYWILIHLWHEPEHILGDFEYPDPSKWTDEELGISN